jgi:hypothetical protein
MRTLLRPKGAITRNPARRNVLSLPNHTATPVGFVEGYASTIPPPRRRIACKAAASATGGTPFRRAGGSTKKQVIRHRGTLTVGRFRLRYLRPWSIRGRASLRPN